MNATQEEATQAREGSGGTILFVDDEPLSLKYFKASVGRYAKVLTASSPTAALEIMAAHGDTISVVVSDERMPHDSGASFLSEVRKSWPSTVRVLTSAYADIDSLRQAINGAAIYRFVPKPWDLDELCGAMQEALKAERAAEKLVEPLLGPRQHGEAESANVELLAVLARELSAPLAALDAEAVQLAALTRPRPMTSPPNALSQMASWSAQLRLGKIAASANQVQRHVAYCKSLAGSIVGLAEGLCRPSAAPMTSMAETISTTLEEIAVRQSIKNVITLDARQDFRFKAPKPIMNFVLTNLLQSTIRQLSNPPASIAVKLVPGFDYNEVCITAKLNKDSTPASEVEVQRINRCALWASGGELLLSSDTKSGTTSVSVRLPKAETAELVSSSH
jgi:two-component system probable response regulator PhcQ